MKCPKCMHVIDDKLVAKYLAAKGGSKGKRVISSEAQAKMQAGRGIKKTELSDKTMDADSITVKA